METVELRLDAPSPRQRLFFLARSKFVAYGGARGGGKSWALRTKALLMALKYPGIRILILRRTYPELRENHILPMLRMIAPLGELAKYRETDKSISFDCGSRIKFGYLGGEPDVAQYQGQEYDVICMDEATQFTEGQFLAMTAVLRGANRLPKRFYLSCNPGGVGHAWVKRLFIDRAYRGPEQEKDYQFIPARVHDNEALLRADPGYLKLLEGLPDGLRQAWLDGDWDLHAGRYFAEFVQGLHVVDGYRPSGGAKIYRALDYGLDMLACLWVAVEQDGCATVFRELCLSGLVISEAAAAIRAASGENSAQTLAPPDLWHRRQESGRSMAELFAIDGVPLLRASNARVEGWHAVKEWLKPMPGERGPWARLRIDRSCAHLIHALPLLQHDGKNPNDVATQPHEITHAPDALRAFCISMPPGGVQAVHVPLSSSAQRLLGYQAH